MQVKDPRLFVRSMQGRAASLFWALNFTQRRMSNHGAPGLDWIIR